MSIWCQFTCQRSHVWRRMRFILNSFRQWSSCKLKQKYLKRNKSMALSSTLVLVFHLRLVCSVYQTPWKKLIYAIFFMQSDAKQADQNALLVLRNIKVLGFENGNRFQGFDKGTTFKILEVNSIALVLSNCVRWMFMCIEQTMADMHALPIAIRILKPRRFEKTFRPHFKPIDMTYIDPKILPKVYYDWSFVSYIYLIRRSQAVHYDLKYVRINQTLRRKVDAQIKNCIAFSQINKNGSDTPYSTVVHRDLWTNNFMISKGICVDWQSPPAQLMADVQFTDENRNVNDVKVYDFQLYFYHSFALDVIFFLFTSVRLKDLNENFETFIRFYHHRFCQTLKDVNCPLDNYSFEL